MIQREKKEPYRRYHTISINVRVFLSFLLRQSSNGIKLKMASSMKRFSLSIDLINHSLFGFHSKMSVGDVRKRREEVNSTNERANIWFETSVLSWNRGTFANERRELFLIIQLFIIDQLSWGLLSSFILVIRRSTIFCSSQVELFDDQLISCRLLSWNCSPLLPDMSVKRTFVNLLFFCLNYFLILV